MTLVTLLMDTKLSVHMLHLSKSLEPRSLERSDRHIHQELKVLNPVWILTQIYVSQSAQTQGFYLLPTNTQCHVWLSSLFMVMWQLMNVVCLFFMLNNHFIPRLHALLLWFHSLTAHPSLSLTTTGWQWMENADKSVWLGWVWEPCLRAWPCENGITSKLQWIVGVIHIPFGHLLQPALSCSWANLKCSFTINLICQKSTCLLGFDGTL